MILYMLQCHSPKSSHPLPLPQSPKDCSIHQCLFCCLTYRVIIIVFLNPYICISILYWCFSFWLTSLCIIGSSFIHPIRTDSIVFRGFGPPITRAENSTLLSNGFYDFSSGYKFGLVIVLFKVSASCSKKAEQEKLFLR